MGRIALELASYAREWTLGDILGCRRPRRPAPTVEPIAAEHRPPQIRYNPRVLNMSRSATKGESSHSRRNRWAKPSGVANAAGDRRILTRAR